MLINERKDVKLKQNLIRNSGENTQNGKRAWKRSFWLFCKIFSLSLIPNILTISIAGINSTTHVLVTEISNFLFNANISIWMYEMTDE